ncbi:MAG: FtsQ-type POTRA domain-containing protein [Ruminococcaceae bacterium]|nr:FtsQ-type POTRA domain-containing protein [Oscillospiraceae bacterium]
MTKPLSEKQKRRRKIIKRRRRVLLSLLIIMIVISICLFTPFFNIKTVEIIGNKNIETERILTAASISNKENIFRLNKNSVKKSIQVIPEIEAVKIKRKLPSKIQITVTETEPFMYLPYETGYAITNESGRVLSLTDSNENLNLLYITGLEIKNAELCKKISVQDTVTFDIIISTLEKFRNRVTSRY